MPAAYARRGGRRSIFRCAAPRSIITKASRADVGFRQKGYLWLYDSATWPKALAHIDLQRSLGHPIETLTAQQVNQRVPEIDRLEGIEGATFSPKDGLINPNLLKNHYRDRARAMGAEFRDGVYIYAIDNGTDWRAPRHLACRRADDRCGV